MTTRTPSSIEVIRGSEPNPPTRSWANSIGSSPDGHSRAWMQADLEVGRAPVARR